MKRVFLLFPLLAVLWGCQDRRVADLLREYGDSRFVRIAEAQGHRVEVRYLPRAYLLLSRSGVDSSRVVTQALLDSLEKAAGTNDGSLTFLLRLSAGRNAGGKGIARNVLYGNLSGYDNYQETQQAYLFGLKEKIWMESGGARISLGSYQMENTFGITPDLTFTLVFPNFDKDAKTLSAEIVLDDIVPGLARKKLDFTLPKGSF